MYEIEITNTVHHHLRKLSPSTQRRVDIAIDRLSENPRPDGVKKLKGEVDFYRIRVGDYRILYLIDDRAALVTIMRIMPRENVY